MGFQRNIDFIVFFIKSMSEWEIFQYKSACPFYSKDYNVIPCIVYDGETKIFYDSNCQEVIDLQHKSVFIKEIGKAGDVIKEALRFYNDINVYQDELPPTESDASNCYGRQSVLFGRSRTPYTRSYEGVYTKDN